MVNSIGRSAVSLCLAISVLSFAYAGRAEDYAIVVGVRTYKSFKAAPELIGAENDSRAVAKALEKKGFNVKYLLTEQATHQAIIDALIDARGKCGKNDRFVFYFAGHGRLFPRAAFLPYDATDSGNDIPADGVGVGIHDLVNQVPAKSRTVLLDSCHSGALAKDVTGLESTLIARFYQPFVTKGPSASIYQDRPSAGLQKSKDVCYLTAASATEPAYEMVIGGERHGLMTWALMDYLNSEETPVWSEVASKVSLRIADKLQHKLIQRPVLTKEYRDARMFDPPPTGPVATPPESKLMWDEYSADMPDDKKLTLTVEPQQLQFRPGEPFTIKMHAGVDGYLVLVNRDERGMYTTLWPKRESADDAFIKGGQEKPLALRASMNRGMEELKAMLFESRDRAEMWIGQLPPGQPTESSAFRVLSRKSVAITPYATSRRSFGVVPELIGGGPLKDPAAIATRMREGSDAAARYILSQYPRDKHRDIIRNTKPGQPLTPEEADMVLVGLNWVIARCDLSKVSEFTSLSLPEETKALLAKPENERDRAATNLALLRSAFASAIGQEKSQVLPTDK